MSERHGVAWLIYLLVICGSTVERQRLLLITGDDERDGGYLNWTLTLRTDQ